MHAALLLTCSPFDVAEPEDAIDGVFGHKRDNAHCEHGPTSFGVNRWTVLIGCLHSRSV